MNNICKDNKYFVITSRRGYGFTLFQQIGKARRAAELTHTGIKVIVRDGVFYQFPDGHKMSIASTIDLKTDTIAAWLSALNMIRKERST